MKKNKVYTSTCENCKSKLTLTKGILKSETMTVDDIDVIVTYVSCPVCGHNSLKQIDTGKTYLMSEKLVIGTLKQEKRQRQAHTSKKERLQKLDKQLGNMRGVLKKKYWAQISQRLNDESENC